MPTVSTIHLRGTRASQPAAGTGNNGTLYFVTDEGVTERSNGTTWESYSGSSGVSPHHTTHESGGSDVVTLAQSQVTNLTTDLAGKAASIHALSHASAGSDPLNVTSLSGFPGGGTTFLRDDNTFAAIPSAPAVRRQIILIIDGGASVITTGFKTSISIPVGGTLKKWRILADLSGSIVIDVWKDVFANYPPTAADTIVASAKPTLSGALSAESSTLTGWTTSFLAGDVFGFNVDSVATVKKISLTLEFE